MVHLRRSLACCLVGASLLMASCVPGTPPPADTATVPSPVTPSPLVPRPSVTAPMPTPSVAPAVTPSPREASPPPTPAGVQAGTTPTPGPTHSAATATPTPSPPPVPSRRYEDASLGLSLAYGAPWTLTQLSPVAVLEEPNGGRVVISGEPLDGLGTAQFAEAVVKEFAQELPLWEELSREWAERFNGLLVRGRMVQSGVLHGVTALVTHNGAYGVVVAQFAPERDAGTYTVGFDRVLASLRWTTPTGGLRDDHGDQVGTATPVRLGESLRGAVGHGGDVDWFRFAGAPGRRYQLAVSPAVLAEGRVTLFVDQGGGPCPLTWASGAEELLLRWAVRTHTTYFFEVEAAGRGTVGTYALTLTSSDADPTDDHGNHPCSATGLELGVPEPGDLETVDDVDVFAVPVSVGRSYAVQVHGESEGARLTVTGAGGETLATGEWQADPESGGTREVVHWHATASGDHYLAVAAADEEGSGPYTVTVTFERATSITRALP